jgi:hypothetical protein
MTEPNNSWAQPEGGAPAPVENGPAPVRPAKKSGSGRLTNALFLVAALVAVGGLAFASGRLTAPAAAAGLGIRGGGFPGGSFDPGQGFPGGSFDPGQGFPGGAPGGDRSIAISGTVTSLDGTTLVIAAEDGTATTIDVSGAEFHAQATATAADVTAGATVSVTVDGFGGGFRPGSSPDPNGGSGSATITATEVTITGQ